MILVTNTIHARYSKFSSPPTKTNYSQTPRLAQMYTICLLCGPLLQPNIKKLDKLLNKLTKEICNIFKSTTNILTHLNNKDFNINTTSLPNYLHCIRQNFIQVLNDPRQLETIYQGITKHIIAKYGGSPHLHSITKINTLKILEEHTKRLMENIHQNTIEHLTDLVLNKKD